MADEQQPEIAPADTDAFAQAFMDAENAKATEPIVPGGDPAGVLNDIELEATLQFGFREMPLREVLALVSGDVVELNRHVSEPVDLVVGDRILARGEVVVANGNFALRITEIAAPQLRLESIGCQF